MATQAVVAIEDGGGTDAATVTSIGTIWTRTAMTLTANATFNENEDVVLNITTAGSTAGAAIVELMFLLED